MKTLKATCAALVIALSLAIPAYAEDPKDPEDIHQPGAVHPPGSSSGGTTLINDGGTTPINDDGFSLADILSALIGIF